MKADIFLHIPMKYGVYWYMASQKLKHNNCNVSFSDIPYNMKFKHDQYGLFCILEIRYLSTSGHQNVRTKYICVHITTHNFHKRIFVRRQFQ